MNHPPLVLPLYKVVKQHHKGLLTGLTTTEFTTAKFTEGWTCHNAIGGGGYTIQECRQVGTREIPRHTSLFER